ncbi:MAG: D-allose kinase [Candidatus Erwinia impunctatus]
MPLHCGNSGCVETLTSGHWLTIWHKQNVPDTPFTELFSVHHRNPDLQAFLQRLAAIISNEMNIIDPQYLFLGGGVLAMDNFPMETLCHLIRRSLRPPLTKNNLQFVFSRATDQTGCRGACLAAQRLFGEGL